MTSRAENFTAVRSIPFNRPALVGSELEYIRQAVESGHLSGDGNFTKKCHGVLEAVLAVPKVLLTTSCTHALELAALLLDLEPDDEVIVPSFTFVSTVNAFVLRGARPRFVDVHADTLNMDEGLLAGLITQRTKAIVPVHYAGVACEMDEITALAGKHGVTLVEDNAHGLFATYRGRYLGTFGALATQSFHETKNVTCGEGGALLINDSQLVERAEILREKGTDRSRFFRGQVDKYTWVDVGSSYLPSEILAAFLYAQFEMRDRIQAARRRVWESYAEQLRDWSEEHGIRLPIVPPNREQSYHMFYLLMPSLEVRTTFIDYLKERGINAVFHYQPLHLSAMGRHFGGRAGDCPVTEDVSQRLVRLPFYSNFAEDDQQYVIDTIRRFRR